MLKGKTFDIKPDRYNNREAHLHLAQDVRVKAMFWGGNFGEGYIIYIEFNPTPEKSWGWDHVVNDEVRAKQPELYEGVPNGCYTWGGRKSEYNEQGLVDSLCQEIFDEAEDPEVAGIAHLFA
jgi:hypothetical protein